MNYLTFIPIFLFFILFFVTLIEYLTGAEKEGLKIFFFFIILILLISFLSSLEFSKNLAQKFVEMLAGVVSAFK